MFVVGNILISDDVLDAPFACNLGACRGGCCVHGDSGAPLEPEERATLEALVPLVADDLTPEARALIETDGVWEETDSGTYGTTCVPDGACVFVTYEQGIARCAIQKAYYEGRTPFPKPISCHLFPIRVERFGDYEALNYEKINLCDPARTYGRQHRIQLDAFLREPLVRKYGEAWYQAFQQACDAQLAPSGHR